MGQLRRAGAPAAGVDIADGDRRFALRIAHATTPVDPARTLYWWFFSQDYGHGEGAVAALTERITAAFVDDKTILEASEAMVCRDPRGRDYLDVSVACDHAGVEARRRVARLAAAEAA